LLFLIVAFCENRIGTAPLSAGFVIRCITNSLEFENTGIVIKNISYNSKIIIAYLKIVF